MTTEAELEKTLGELLELGIMTRRWDPERRDWIYRVTEKGAAVARKLVPDVEPPPAEDVDQSRPEGEDE